MARIRFLSDQVYDTGAPGRGPRFEKDFVLDAKDVGSVLKEDVSDEYADSFLDRWVRRGVAEYVDGRTPATEVDAVKPAEPAKPPVVSQPLGTEQRGRATTGLDDGKQVARSESGKAPQLGAKKPLEHGR